MSLRERRPEGLAALAALGRKQHLLKHAAHLRAVAGQYSPEQDWVRDGLLAARKAEAEAERIGRILAKPREI